MKKIETNHRKATIEMTAEYERAARKVDSDEYKELKAIRSDNPNYRLVIVKTKKSRVFDGMDYNFMVHYIEKHENSEKNLTEFNTLKAANVSYGEMKQWFLNCFPQFKEFKTRVEWLLAA